MLYLGLVVGINKLVKFGVCLILVDLFISFIICLYEGFFFVNIRFVLENVIFVYFLFLFCENGFNDCGIKI